MNKRTRNSLLLLMLLSGVMSSCATPIGPSGGPPDKTGPVIESTFPESGTTNFEGRRFEFQFDEYVRRSSVSNAITIEPDFGGEYDLSWKRKKLTLTFKESLPDSTTVIVKLGTDITDNRSNKIARPVTLAISTGDEIDEGRIRGRVLNAKDGKAAIDQKIFLYREPVDFSKRARYQAQTDTGGYFEFSYLAAGTYKAVLLNDRNRNKIWEPASESAYPFFRENIELSEAATDTLDVIYTSQMDTLAPEIQGVGLFSSERMRIRFSETVELTEESTFSITDSLGNPYTEAYPLYVLPTERFVVFAQSGLPLLEENEYNVTAKGLTDPSGNEVLGETFNFSGSGQSDTTRQRIIFANDANGLLQDEAFTVTYAAPITAPEVLDSLVVIEGTVDFNDWPNVETIQNKLHIRPQGKWIEGLDYEFLVWNPESQRRSMYAPEMWDSTEYGEIELTIPGADSAEAYYYVLQDNMGNVRASDQFKIGTVINELPPLAYTLTLFRDENGNGQWDRGTVTPYRRPESYYVQQNLNVQEGFTSQVTLSFD